jgi:hypothetical protein
MKEKPEKHKRRAIKPTKSAYSSVIEIRNNPRNISAK